MSVPPSIGAPELLQRCMASIAERWLEWSNGYDLPEGVAHLECKGVQITGEKDCIQQYFAKKSRGGAAAAGSNRPYDFSIILDVHLMIKHKFYVSVCSHREQVFQAAEGATQEVCGDYNHVFQFFTVL